MISDTLQASEIGVIATAVGAHYDVSLADILGPNRTSRFVIARHVAMFVAREVTGLSFPDLGRAFGGRDHSSVMYAVQRIREALETDAALVETVAAIRAGLGHPLPPHMALVEQVHALKAQRDQALAERDALRATLGRVRAAACFVPETRRGEVA